MKKIKVYMQHPWKISDSNYYKSLLDYAPTEVKYINKVKKIGNITNKRKFLVNHYIKQNVKKIINFFYPSMPNAHRTKYNGDYDVVHCAHCLSLNKSPWVADIEHPGQFWATGGEVGKNKRRIRKLLMSKCCKKILPWSEWTRRETLKMFPELKDKMEIVTYALPVSQKDKKNKDTITLGFISRRFIFKGGLHALEVIDRLTKKYDNVNAVFVSEVPVDVLKKYSKNKKIKFYNILPYSKILNEIFPSFDIFILPSYTDTFGFPMVEALSFGIPVVTVDGQSRKEIIKDGKTGFVIDKPDWKVEDLGNLTTLKNTIDSLQEKTERLIKDKILLKNMSDNAIKEVRDGKFSLERRNEKLTRIYREAMK
ncbi:glycosyltransferase family 4 protein [Methanococcoides sp. SA1]|nr:glycosyltransferase family 4 protein [Methanococcoides sp. SA1]